MIFYIIALVYIVVLLLGVYINNKIVRDSFGILKIVSQNIDNINHHIAKYIYQNKSKIVDIQTLEEVAFNPQKQYINSNFSVAEKNKYYNKQVENIKYIYSLTWDAQPSIDQEETVKSGFSVLESNKKLTDIIRIIVSTMSLGILYLFCQKI